MTRIVDKVAPPAGLEPATPRLTAACSTDWAKEAYGGGAEESQSLQVLALPIFPVRLQTSIFGASELNFRVRDGNGWTLTAINTNSGCFPHPQNRTK